MEFYACDFALPTMIGFWIIAFSFSTFDYADFCENIHTLFVLEKFLVNVFCTLYRGFDTTCHANIKLPFSISKRERASRYGMITIG